MARRSAQRKVLVLHGPNLNALGRRDVEVYGSKTLAEVNGDIKRRASELGLEVEVHQSNSEGELIDAIQAASGGIVAIVVNPGALTHYGLSLREALHDSGLPVFEVHLSNIYAREPWRAHSVVAPVARGQIAGFGALGYVFALEAIAAGL